MLAQWERQEPGITKTNLQGKRRTYSDRQVEFVVNQYQAYSQERKRVKIKAFMKHLTRQWGQQGWLTRAPSRKTVADILSANDLYRSKVRSATKNSYHDPMKKYFPQVQSVMDGKEVVVSINSNDYPFILEYSKDIASDAICGAAIGQSESAELVKTAYQDHVHHYGRPLATLVDHGTGNQKAAIDLGGEGTLVIKSWPHRPQSKAPIEGEFSIFEKTVSHIHITGQQESDLALSMLETISRMYLRLRNGSPRCSVCPFTPAKLIQAKVTAINSENAYRVLTEQQELRAQSREKLQKIDAEKKELLESIIQQHGLTGDRYRFKRSLKWVEMAVIKEAEQIFSVYSQKDNFDESKRTMAYFSAMARNIQQQRDQQRKEEMARLRYGLEQRAQQRRQALNQELLRRKEAALLEQEPHRSIVNAIMAEMNLPADFRTKISIFKKMIDEGIITLLKKKRQQQQTLLAKTKQEIMGLWNLSLEERYKWVKYIDERMSQLARSEAKVVTPN